jgi:hypothetical protein
MRALAVLLGVVSLVSMSGVTSEAEARKGGTVGLTLGVMCISAGTVVAASSWDDEPDCQGDVCMISEHLRYGRIACAAVLAVLGSVFIEQWWRDQQDLQRDKAENLLFRPGAWSDYSLSRRAAVMRQPAGFGIRAPSSDQGGSRAFFRLHARQLGSGLTVGT